jgi:antitoxin (DNA-binding transcriptional repressor) of toxin-antitoxin stability system
MATASVSQLKANLSRYLRMVRRGSEVQILERGIPIARLSGLSTDRASHPEEAKRLDRLARAGILRRGRGDLAWLRDAAPLQAPGSDVSGALAQDREDRV